MGVTIKSVLQAKSKLNTATENLAQELSSHLQQVMGVGYEQLVDLLSNPSSCFYSQRGSFGCEFDGKQRNLANIIQNNIDERTICEQKIFGRNVYYHTRTMEEHKTNPNLKNTFIDITNIIKENTLLIDGEDDQESHLWTKSSHEYTVNPGLKFLFTIKTPKTDGRHNKDGDISLSVILTASHTEGVKSDLTEVLD